MNGKRVYQLIILFYYYRERRERELEYFLKKKYNRLGNKFKAKITGINSLKTNPNLILK